MVARQVRISCVPPRCQGGVRTSGYVRDMASLILSILSIAIAAVAVAISYWLGARTVQAAERSALAAEVSQQLAERQFAAAVQAQEARLQPYVWADLRPRDDGQMLVFVVGNSGPTVATDVRVTCRPALVDIVPKEQQEKARVIEDLLRSGLSSIAPGRTFMWNLGVAHTYFPNDGADPVGSLELDINALGPRGELEVVRYVIALEDLKQQAARATGIALLEAPLKAIAKALNEKG